MRAMPSDSGVTTIRCDQCGKANRVPVAADGKPRCGNCKAALPWLVDAGDDSFADVVDRAHVPVLVDLWAPWCGPCRMVSPALEQIAHELAGRIKLVKVNVDTAPAIARRFEAQSIPMLIMMSDGQVLARRVGAAPADQLRTWVAELLPDKRPETGPTSPSR
jgi:thioredoxin 2